MARISTLNDFSPLVLKPPRNADKMPTKIDRLKKKVIARREALEQEQAALTFCGLTERHWGWIGTVAGGLGYAAALSGVVSQIQQLESSDSNSQTSTTTKAIGIVAGTFGLVYVTVKTVVGCISKKKAKLITPYEDEVKELKSLERLFTAMSLLSSDEEAPLELQEERLMKCTKKIQKQQKNWLPNNYKYKWVNMLVKKLPDSSEIKLLMNQGNVLTEACVVKGDAVNRSPEEISIKIEESSSESASGDPVRLFAKVRQKIHRENELGPLQIHAWGDPQECMSIPTKADGSSGSSSKSISFSSLVLSDHTNVAESSSNSSASSPPPRGGRESSTPSKGISSSSGEEHSENIPPKMEENSPVKDLPENLKARKEMLRGIAEKLHDKLGLTEFYNPAMKVYFDIHGNITRKGE